MVFLEYHRPCSSYHLVNAITAYCPWEWGPFQGYADKLAVEGRKRALVCPFFWCKDFCWVQCIECGVGKYWLHLDLESRIELALTPLGIIVPSPAFGIHLSNEDSIFVPAISKGNWLIICRKTIFQIRSPQPPGHGMVPVQPVRYWATQQEVSLNVMSLNHPETVPPKPLLPTPTLSMENLFSMKPVPCAKMVGDRCFR